MESKIILLLLLLLSVITPGLCDEPADNFKPVADEVDNLLAIYMIGGDLESDFQAGTYNIAEILDGYASANTSDLEIVVAYGGSKTPGWEGVTYATAEELMKDASDGVIGNEQEVSFNDPDADMGSQETLKDFLTFVNQTYPAKRTLLIFWDHGSGYEGFGLDEVYDSQLALSDIKQVLETTGTTYDFIGFDACLMGSLEVARTMEPFGKIMVASEETEPSTGWNYESWIHAVSEDPDISSEEIGTVIVDTFMNREDSAKTLSVINLSKIPDLVQVMDNLGTKLDPYTQTSQGYRSIGKAYQIPARYGKDNRESGETSVDLKSFLEAVKDQNPDISDEVNSAISLLDEAVLYTKNDEYVSESGGLSIMSPSRITPEIYQELGDDARIASGWDAFFANLLEIAGQDTEKPVISETDETFSIDDPFGTASVYTEYYICEDDQMILIGDELLEAGEDGEYQLPDWDGKWFYLQDNLDLNNYALLGMSYDSQVPEGSLLFTSEIDLIRGTLDTAAVLDIYINPESGKNRLVATPYTIRENGEVQFSRQNLELLPNDTIYSYGWEIQEDSPDGGEWVEIGEMTVSEDTTLTYDILPDGFYAQAMYAEYDDNPGNYAGVKIFQIENGEITGVESNSTLSEETSDPEEYTSGEYTNQ